MPEEIELTIDGKKVNTSRGTSILKTALANGIYIPHLCFHPDLPQAEETPLSEEIFQNMKPIKGAPASNMNFEVCGLCIIEVKDRKGFYTACNTPAEMDMNVITESENILQKRKDNLKKIFASHPHACIVCEQKDGCDRNTCPPGVPGNERCCSKFEICELRKVAEYTGIGIDTPKYNFKNLPDESNSIFRRNHNLCIACGRCVRACLFLQKKRAIEYLLKSDKKNIETVPEAPGIFRLFNDKKNIICINGTPNLKQELTEKLGSVPKAVYFNFEKNQMYSMRENELLQRYMKEHGSLPEINNELEELLL
jgi:hypothetical protein